jgi:hypothetical protein
MHDFTPFFINDRKYSDSLSRSAVATYFKYFSSYFKMSCLTGPGLIAKKI